MKQFWNDAVTSASEKYMYEFCKEFQCLVIGGWATYLHTKAMKSKDLDVIIDFETLSKLKEKYPKLSKNDRLKKYEIKLPSLGFDVDIYLSEYSNIGFSLEQVVNSKVVINGITVPRVEELLAMKINAYDQRKDSTKGEKDIRDIVSLLYYCDVNVERLKKIEQFSKAPLVDTLRSIIQSLKELPDLDINQYQYKKRIKSKYL